METISIIIPLFNKEAVVERTIASVQAQGVKNIEIVVVDDGSSDASAAVVRRLMRSDPRIKIYTQKNAGPGAARNLGLRVCKGRYVSFLDADDAYEAEFLRTALSRLDENKGDDCRYFVSAHFRTSQGSKRNFAPYFSNFGVRPGLFSVSSATTPTELLGLVWFQHSSAVVCDKALVQQCGGYYDKERCLFGEDAYLWVIVILSATGYHEMLPLAWYHTEDSDLCGGGPGDEYPAMLRNPTELVGLCPLEKRELLSDFLGLYALMFVATVLLPKKRYIEGLELLEQIPTSCKFSGYQWLRTHLSDPGAEGGKGAAAFYSRNEWMNLIVGPADGRPWSSP